MAQRVEVILVDDTDGSSASESVSFALDGVSYEIDLSDANAKALRDDFAKWTGHARRAGSTGGRRTRRTGAAASRRTDLGAVREWARANGHQVSDRGRISAEIQAAYDKAH